MEFEWIDKQDEIDDVLAEDINKIAHEIIEIDKNFDSTGVAYKAIADKNGNDIVDTYATKEELNATMLWQDVRDVVRKGMGANVFPVGYEFTTEDSVTGNNIVWVVRGHDHHTASNKELTHTMTLEAKYAYSDSTGQYIPIVFDSENALYYVAEEIPAGTYNFTWNFAVGSVLKGTYQFTLTNAVPVGGQIVIDTGSSATAIVDCKISTYATVGATEAIESNIVVTEGSGGTNLGTIGGTSSNNINLNCASRILWGSNNYAQSAVRQWINSMKTDGNIWTPQTIFDRPPNWKTNFSGFMRGLPDDFLAVIESAEIPCSTNGQFEVNSLDGTEYTKNQEYILNDKFFLLSQSEIYGTYDNASFKDGELLEFYKEATNTERVKYDMAGVARSCWLRTPRFASVHINYLDKSDGTLYSTYSFSKYGVTPACIIA